MLYTEIAIFDFKKRFFREFDFTFSSIAYDPAKTYNLNDKVIYFDESAFTMKAYISKVANNTSIPTDDVNWDVDNAVNANIVILDTDIQQSLDFSKRYIDNALFNDEDAKLEGVYLLTAHELYIKVNPSVISADNLKPISSKSASAGSFAVSFDTTNLYNNNANLILRSTKYGMMFLDLKNRYTSSIYLLNSDRIIES